jgi:hypothetical protein
MGRRGVGELTMWQLGRVRHAQATCTLAQTQGTLVPTLCGTGKSWGIYNEHC